MNRAIRFKFGTYIEDGPLRAYMLENDHKWAWPRSRDLISKFWDPSITFERIEQSAANSVQRWRTDLSYVYGP